MKIRSLLSGLVLMLAAAVCPAADVIWCEAELFREQGGWLNDSQFVDQMGSPFLMAYGLEGPVKDAVTTVDVAAAGKYRLWVRSRDWLPEYSPGRFQVVLAGKPVTHVFGQSKAKGWVWEDGGVQQLTKGRMELRLHDLTGHYGRCDAVVLVNDLGYRPPDQVAKLESERIARGGVSRQVKRLPDYDTVVVGGGLAGTFAAVASARMGCRTALVQDRPVLGGNGSTEVLVRPEGDTTREPLDPGEGGVIEEVRGSLEGYSDRMADVCKKEKNLDLIFNTHATGVELKTRGTIAAVKAIDVTTKQRLLIPGTTFIDCTGDGAIGVWAGAEWRHGREPRSMYNETRAPLEADGRTMGGTLRYTTELAAGPVAFQAPAWAHKFTRCEDFNIDRHPQLTFGGWQWVIEYGGMRNTYTDAEEIRDELLRIIWGMWDHAKNHCPRLAKEAANYKLAWVSYVVGKRESRRLIGDYVMTEHDIAQTVLFPDRVSYAGWGIDIHPPGGFWDKEPPATFSHRVKFSVPFRSLYTKDVGNLMMAGRCISVTHAALGATRVMITCGLQGQAVGTAAGFCKMHQTTPRGVYQSYIADLQQQLLKDGCYLIDLPNQDPRDLARQARATASSQSAPIKITMPRSGLHPLGNDRAVMFKADRARLASIWLQLQSDNSKPTALTLRLCHATRSGDFDSTEDLASAKASVPARSKAWIRFDLNADLKPGDFYFVWLPKTAGVSWYLFDPAPADTSRAYRAAKGWTSTGESYTFRFDAPAQNAIEEVAGPKPPPADMFAAAHVVDGFARAVRGVPHAWRPDPRQPLPQWVELDFGKPARFNTVHVTFQSKDMRAEQFRLETFEAGQWRAVAEVVDNPDRRRVLSFAPQTAQKLRLVLVKAKRDAGVCEIRVYDEPAEGQR
jgi:hypothetical protein